MQAEISITKARGAHKEIMSNMTFESIKSVLESHKDFSKIIFNDLVTHDDVIVLLENGDIIGAYNKNNRFRSRVRAGFSIDREIAQTSSDQGALNIKLADTPDVLADWKENYVITTLADLAYDGFSESEVTLLNEDVRSDEESSVIDAVAIDDVAQSVDREIADLNTVYEKLDINDYSAVTLSLLHDFIPSSDEQNFVKLATSTGKDLESILKYSDGFLLSSILDTSIILTENGSIEYVDLSSGNRVTLGFEKPANLSEEQDTIHKYVDDHLEDGSDHAAANDIIEEGLAADQEIDSTSTEAETSNGADNENNDDSSDNDINSIPVLNLPDIAAPDDDAEHSEPSDADNAGDTDSEDVSILQPVTAPTPDLTQLLSDAPLTTEDTESTVEQDDVDDVDNLISIVEKARQRLDDLKAHKEEVDSKINDLPVEEEEKIQKSLDSLNSERDEIDGKITDLRAQKSDVDEQITDALKHLDEVKEALSHKDELNAELENLTVKITSLESVLTPVK